MHGVVTSQRLRCLRPILEQWCDINAQLGREWCGVNDAPWWYNERASVSVFAGAVWRSGEAAFEEYSELKRGKAKLTAGRFDLWFSCGRQEFLGEAKFCNVPSTRAGTQARGVQSWMERAKADARRCPPDGTKRRLAIVFGCPYLRPCSADKREARIRWLVAESSRVEHDAMAWVFPKLSRPVRIRDWDHPGVVVWIREVRR